MERTLYCSLGLLDRVQALEASDWRHYVFHKLDVIYINRAEVEKRFPELRLSQEDYSIEAILEYAESSISMSEEEYIMRDEGLMQENSSLVFFQTLRDSFGARQVRFVGNVEPSICENGAVCEDVVDDVEDYARMGIFSFDPYTDPNMGILQDHIYSTTTAYEHFSWSELLCKPLPTSNSAVIVDRYLFKSNQYGYGRSVFNVVELLKTIIPLKLKGPYSVSIVFEYEQLKGNNGHGELMKSLAEINNSIYHELKKCNRDVKLTFIAVKDPKQSKNPQKTWKQLHNHIHDRYVLTSYYWLFATGELSAENTNETASRWQNVQYMELLYGVGNKYQRIGTIPFIKITEYLNMLMDLIGSAPSDKYYLFRYDYKQKKIQRFSNVNLLRNPLLCK